MVNVSKQNWLLHSSVIFFVNHKDGTTGSIIIKFETLNSDKPCDSSLLVYIHESPLHTSIIILEFHQTQLCEKKEHVRFYLRNHTRTPST